MKQYKVYLIMSLTKIVPFGDNNGVCEAKSPMDAIKRQSQFPLNKVEKIASKDTTKYRAKADGVAKVVNEKGQESYYAMYVKN